MRPRPAQIDTSGSSAGDVLTSPGAGSGPAEWAAPGIGAGGSGMLLLAIAQYDPVSFTTKTTTSATYVDADATNLAVTFTAPASGNVLVYQESAVKISATTQSAYWGVRDGSTDITGSGRFITQQTLVSRLGSWVRLTGLTPTTSYTWKWSFRTQGTQTQTIQFGGTTEGPGIMAVFSA